MRLILSAVMAVIATTAGAQTITVGIKDSPCDFINSSNSATQDFGGQCKYEKLNAQLPAPGAQRVVWFGDSITEFMRNGIVGLDPADTINRGISGQTTSQMRVRFHSDVINLRPLAVHIMAGTNDIAGNTGPTSLERMKDAFRSMAEEASANGIKVILGSILPAKRFSWRAGISPAETIRTFNSWLKDYADKKGFIYVDYHSAMVDSQGGLPAQYSNDDVHPNDAGYAVMKPLAAEALARAIK